jgi:hypothetical protein
MHHSGHLHHRSSVVAGAGQSATAGLIAMPVPRINRADWARRRNATATLQFQQRPIATGKVRIGCSAAPRYIDIEPVAGMKRAFEMPGQGGCPGSRILGKGSWCRRRTARASSEDIFESIGAGRWIALRINTIGPF